MFINKISIKNFRSIEYVELSLKNLTIFFGKNDVGKSTVLKALNLFFNGETDINTPFDFSSDFNLNAKVSSKKAREIEIKLELIPPDTYKSAKVNIIWTKKWRANGFFKEYRTYIDKSEIKGRTKLNNWMDELHYQYVPAIKGTEYFEYLLKLLYQNLIAAKTKDLQDAGLDFINRIRENTISMSDELKQKIGIESKIQLPKDLSGLFATLDFETENQMTKVPLRQRGDGIKVKHIPVILNFLNEYRTMNNIQGEARKNTIWGYEEPENNLELSNAFHLSQDFINYSSKLQILITTHSPAFYYLKSRNDKVIKYYVKLPQNSLKNDYKIISESELPVTNEDMGVLSLIATQLEEYNAKKKQLEELEKKYKENVKPILYFEGPSDAILFKAAYKSISKVVITEKFSIPQFEKEDNGAFGSGAAGLNQFLYNHSTKIPVKNLIFTIFDADKEGLDQLQSLKKFFEEFLPDFLSDDKEKYNERVKIYRHKIQKNFFALNIVVPEHRKEFFNIKIPDYCFVTTELLLTDSEIPEQNRKKPSPNEDKIFKFSSNKKVKFAEAISKKTTVNFDGFKPTFDLINRIIEWCSNENQ
ncbi:MAG: hypothetical protein IFNCLDLE_02643 [Ignavibacteriaceae bacterium]|nr:hypothetical protein [Ignavibacteriaceae bacterium]